MATGKEIRSKIKSVENTKKITKAMEMVAASKMRKAQDRMHAARPYSDKVRDMAAHLSQANPDYSHPFLVKHEGAKKVGFVLVSTDKGLCGGLNTNAFRALTLRMRDLDKQGVKSELVAVGSKGVAFLNRARADVVSQVVHLGDTPHLEKLIGPVKALLDAYQAGELDAVYLVYTKFINTMKQQPVIDQLLPLPEDKLAADAHSMSWEYIYEPDMASVIDELLMRYVEALIYQAVAENMASEQSARMVAMKAATDNAGNVIKELKLVYNKTRQAAITTELTEIVAGAAAV